MSILPIGYPDFSRRAARSDQLLWDGEIGPGGTAQDTEVYSVAGTSALGINAFGSSGDLRYDIDWYMDEARAVYLVTQQVHLDSGREFTGSIPCLGPFVQITTFGSGFGEFHDLKLWTVWQAGPHSMEIANTQLVSRDAINVAAGGSTAEVAAVIWPGLATLNILTALATWRVLIEANRHDGSAYTLYRFNQTGGNTQTHHISLPMQSVRVTFFNDTGAAGLANVYLNGATYLPIT